MLETEKKTFGNYFPELYFQNQIIQIVLDIVLKLVLACAQPAATPTHIFRPIGDKQLPCWTQAWEDRPTQVLTVAHGGERSNDTA